MTSFRIVTFGCKVNQCDSQVLRETLASWGLTEASLTEAGITGAAHTKTGRESEAGVRDVDLVVINTCVVTGTAEAKFRKALRRAKRENPHAVTVVTGCYANKTPSTFEQLPGVDLMFRTRDFSALA
ncbi:MAG: hypothetical protein JSV16_14740, partial [Candidatus Hydrogenedentota bacterium]